MEYLWHTFVLYCTVYSTSIKYEKYFSLTCNSHPHLPVPNTKALSVERRPLLAPEVWNVVEGPPGASLSMSASPPPTSTGSEAKRGQTRKPSTTQYWNTVLGQPASSRGLSPFPAPGQSGNPSTAQPVAADPPSRRLSDDQDVPRPRPTSKAPGLLRLLSQQSQQVNLAGAPTPPQLPPPVPHSAPMHAPRSDTSSGMCEASRNAHMHGSVGIGGPSRSMLSHDSGSGQMRQVQPQLPSVSAPNAAQSQGRTSRGSSSKSFKCPHCSRSFERKGHMTEHVNAVHKQLQLFACRFCTRTFGYKSSMERHVAKFHPSGT